MRIVLLSLLAFSTNLATVFSEDALYTEPASGDIQWKVTWKTQGEVKFERKNGALVIRAEGEFKGYAAVKIVGRPPEVAADYTVEVTATCEVDGPAPTFYALSRDAAGRLINYQGLGEFGTTPKTRKKIFSIPTQTAMAEIGVGFSKANGTVTISSVLVKPLGFSMDLLAKYKPTGGTLWASTGIDRTYGKEAFAPRARDTGLKLMACAGINATRGGVRWSKAEAEKGKMDFDEFKAQLQLYEHYGISPAVVCLGYVPSWASGKSGANDLSPEEKKKLGDYKTGLAYWPPKDYKDWEHFVEETVKLGKGRVAAYEILNEPDIIEECFMGNYSDYANFLKHAYAAVKRVDPQAQVLTAAFVRGEWLGRLFEDGFTNYFDGVCSHPYSGSGLGAAQRNRAVLVETILAGAPKSVWVTEVGFQSGGWPTGPGVRTNEIEKAREGKIALEEIAKLSRFVAWYGSYEKGNMYGLCRIEDNGALRPMPVYFAYGEVTGAFKKSEPPITVSVEGVLSVKAGGQAKVRLVAKNVSGAELAVKLWPVGFTENLNPNNAGPNAQDFEGKLGVGE
ncbi:MAG: hypothetical protein JNM63_01400, partial [Spirochaetia bacterium]|nr:hypothetical protein [Spirochaetia bacterium]